MNQVEEAAHRVQLRIVRSEDFRGAREIIKDRNREDLNAHLLLDLSPGSLVFKCLIELGYSVIIFISVFPPFRAQLANVLERILLQVVCQCLQLLVDLYQIL